MMSGNGPLNVNPYYRFADHAIVPPDTPRPEAQAVSAARLLTALLKARDGLVDGSAAPATARGDPYCPTSFKYLFNASQREVATIGRPCTCGGFHSEWGINQKNWLMCTPVILKRVTAPQIPS